MQQSPGNPSLAQDAGPYSGMYAFLGNTYGSTDTVKYTFSQPVYAVKVTMTAMSNRPLTDSPSEYRTEEASFRINGKEIKLDPSNLILFPPPSQSPSNIGIATSTDGSGRLVIVGDNKDYSGNSGGEYMVYSDVPIYEFTVTNRTVGQSNGSYYRLQIANGEINPGAGVRLSDIMPATSDVDAGASLHGWAITSAAASGLGNERWEYSSNNGASWVALTPASSSAAIFLKPDVLVRWTGTRGSHTGLNAVAVDNTSVAVLGDLLDVSVTGGSTPYSTEAKLRGSNNDPSVAGPLTASGVEDGPSVAVDLLAGATDPDADALTVTNVTYSINGGTATSSLPAGVTLSGNSLVVDPSHSSFDALAAGQKQVIKATYTISDGYGGTVNQTASVSINGVNDAPVVDPNNTTVLDGIGLASLNGIVSVPMPLPLSQTKEADLNAYLVGGIAGFPIDISTSTGGSTGTPSIGSFNTLTSGVWLGKVANTTDVQTYTFKQPVYAIYIDMVKMDSTVSATGVTTRDEVSFLINGKPWTLSQTNVKDLNGAATNDLVVSTAADGSGRSVLVDRPQVLGDASGRYVISTVIPQKGSYPIYSLTIQNQSVGDTGGAVFRISLAGGAVVAPGAGLALSTLMPAVSDIDVNDVVRGWAISSAPSKGADRWEYSANGGTTWLSLGSASSSAAIFLTPSTLVRWNGASGGSPRTALSAVAVDNSSTAVLGTVLDVRTTGGTTPYSNPVTVNPVVSPVVMDLDRDGRLEYGSVMLDVTGDGVRDRTAWAGAEDGVLVWDKYGDGIVHDSTQYAFTKYGGMTDLEGLAAAFDTNQDGKFDAADAQFAQFGVWQDADQDGVSDAGEFHSLIDLGITAIDLRSDGVVRQPVAGVTELGQSHAITADGGSILLGDAAFAYEQGVAAEHVIHADAANPVLQGTAGVDVFRWDLASRGSQESVPLSIVKDFDMADGGDKLDLRDLLTGEHHAEGEVGNLLDYLHFSVEGDSTVIDVKSQGAGAPVDQKIVLEGVDLSFGGALLSDQQMLQHLLNHGKLIVD